MGSLIKLRRRFKNWLLNLDQHADSYRKIRNTFRYLLGNLNDDFKVIDISKLDIKRMYRYLDKNVKPLSSVSLLKSGELIDGEDDGEEDEEVNIIYQEQQEV